MTKRIYLHVGAPKSGTTYVQSILRRNRDLLAQHGVLVAGDTHTEVVNAGLVIREDPRAETLLTTEERGAWRRIVEQVRSWEGPVAILSYELLGAATTKQARQAIADLGDAEVHVVVTARDFARSVSSAWQEQLKFSFRRPLEKVGPQPRSEFGWLTLDPRGQAKRWGSELPPERVHIVTVPRPGAAPDELWRRFAEACGIDVPGLDLTDASPNESLGAPAAELLRRVNGHLGEPFTNNREQARWLRDVLAHEVLVPLGGESLGITDEQFERWSRRSEEAIRALAESGYDVRGDLEDLRATRPSGRLPSEISDGELVDVAAQAIVRLLELLREEHLRHAVSSGRRPRDIARRLVHRAVRPVASAELDRMRRRVEELERQVQDSRSLHQRVAELDDIVAALLLPSGRGGNEAVREALRRYRQESV